jgi:choice-of-anchor C domain-containing protein
MLHRLAIAAAVAFSATAARADLITNGSFETSTVGSVGAFTTLSAGSTAITGWTIGAGGIDYIGTYWNAADGSYSLDMSALSAGTISQTLNTIAGHSYSVSFALAGNPDSGPAIKQLLVSATGAGSGAYSFDTTGDSKTAMGWVTETYFFIAQGSSTTLTFASLINNPYGPALDNVSVTDIPAPASIGVMAMGLLGLAFARRRPA